MVKISLNLFASPIFFLCFFDGCFKHLFRPYLESWTEHISHLGNPPLYLEFFAPLKLIPTHLLEQYIASGCLGFIKFLLQLLQILITRPLRLLLSRVMCPSNLSENLCGCFILRFLITYPYTIEQNLL